MMHRVRASEANFLFHRIVQHDVEDDDDGHDDSNDNDINNDKND